MGDIIAVMALRRKRAHLAGEIEAAERCLAQQRAALAKLDAVILLFEPASNPELIPAIRPVSRRNLFFRRGEQMRLCLAALRESRVPQKARWIAEYAMAAKGLPLDRPAVTAQIVEYARIALMRLEKRGLVRRIVCAPDTWWELAAS